MATTERDVEEQVQYPVVDRVTNPLINGAGQK